MRYLSRLNAFGIRWVMQDTGPVVSMSSDQGDDHTGGDANSAAPTSVALVKGKGAAGASRRQSSDASLAKADQRRADRQIKLLETQCVKLSLSLVSRPNNPARSIGFTSAVPGEGKSFLATITASALARQSQTPITLVDCNWEHPTLHTSFNIPASPGLAEWLRNECNLDDIRHEVSPGLTVIPAGGASQDTVALAGALKARGMQTLLSEQDESLIADLPSVLTTSYSALLAQQLDAVLLVVRAGATWDSYVQEASFELSAAPVEGIVLNATRSRIPQWLLRML